MVDQGVVEAGVMERVVEGKLAQEQLNLNHKQDLHQTLYRQEDQNFGIGSRKWKRQHALTKIQMDDNDVATVGCLATATQDVGTKELTSETARIGTSTRRGVTSHQKRRPSTDTLTIIGAKV